MNRRARQIGWLVLATAVLAACAWAQKAVPAPASLTPHGFVNDYAHVLDPSQAAQLEQAAQALNQQLKVQVAMVTVDTTGTTDVFDYSLAVAQKWGVGAKTAANGQDKDTGLLIFLAVKDRKYFTQVGYGLEPYITDADVGTWMRGLRPELRAGQYGAVFAGMLRQIETTLAARMPGAAARLQAVPELSIRSQRRGQDPPAAGLGLLGILVLIWLLGAFASRGRGGGGCFWPLLFLGMMSGGGFGGGYRGGGGWGGGFGGGGGGFGGFGGGGFGGGGAGGSW